MVDFLFLILSVSGKSYLGRVDGMVGWHIVGVFTSGDVAVLVLWVQA